MISYFSAVGGWGLTWGERRDAAHNLQSENNPWFKGFPWEELLKKKLVAPFIPPKEDNFDAKYTNSDWKDANTEQMQQN